MNDVDILDKVKKTLPEVHMATPLEAIVEQGRARRRRSRLARGGLVAAVVLAISLGAFEATGATQSPGRTGVSKLGHTPVHIQLAGYSINSNSEGTVTIRFTDEQSMNPTYMQRVLARAGVPALIRIGSFCHTPTQPSGFEVTDRQGPQGNVMVITPSAMPTGAELSLGYFPGQVAWTMIAIGQPLNCVTRP